MKKDSFFSARVFPLLFMAAVTVVCITVVTGIYLTTEEQVKSNEQLFLRKAVLLAAGISYPENDFAEIQEIFEQRVSRRDGWFDITFEDDRKAYILPITGSGLWGPIEMMLGFSEDLEQMTGISILSHNETPGLGARIEEPWFTEQFRGKKGPFELVQEGTAERDDEIDGITGATRTTAAVGEIVNRGVRTAPEILKGE